MMSYKKRLLQFKGNNRTKGYYIIILLLFIFDNIIAHANSTVISSCDKIPLGYNDRIFQIKVNYPTKIHNTEKPWQNISFKEEPSKYGYTVLKYIYNGNINCDFDLHCNKIANWYHAPWMHYGVNGREFVHGLTREKAFKPGELHSKQKSIIQNWAISIINEQGAYTYGQVWRDINKPDITKGIFLDGTVSAKLVFTEAAPEDIPTLKNSITWTGYINQNNKGTPKVFKQLRLFQIDFLVKDRRSKETGWVAGTFIYDNTMNNENPWFNMKLVGITWGNDPNYFTSSYENRKKLSECWINPNVSTNSLGYLGRLNGPIDNKNSSCLSCHSTAQYPEKSPSVPLANATEAEIKYWFRNLNEQSFNNGTFNFDYSKQISHSVKNYYSAQKENDPIGCNTFNQLLPAEGR
ncbi:hypothetical protein [Rickettsia endosymbiont of Ixodes scapularis]|uniref:hypothetical protein n=1 Tax=Rickettsia endosymbiont of Ixodes scapularis TaxID=444612 RepID=UPI001356D6F7|nr:hypothetical protein [Rickettsia endosymbiont of Ixodes scapularis]